MYEDSVENHKKAPAARDLLGDATEKAIFRYCDQVRKEIVTNIYIYIYFIFYIYIYIYIATVVAYGGSLNQSINQSGDWYLLWPW